MSPPESLDASDVAAAIGISADLWTDLALRQLIPIPTLGDRWSAGSITRWKREEITNDHAAVLAGVGESTWRAYVARGQAPPPKRTVGRTPVWQRQTRLSWLEARSGQPRAQEKGCELEMSSRQALGGHCTRGGTLKSGKAVCECGTWDATNGPGTRKEHLAEVRRIRRMLMLLPDHARADD